MGKNYDDEIEINLNDLLYELLNNWLMILVSTVLVAAIGFCTSKFIMTPMYNSTSELYVLSSGTSITSLADIQIGTYMTNDYLVVVKGRPVLEQVIENLDLNMSYGQLNGKISLNNPSNSRILQITVTDTDPQRAKVIADEVAAVASAYIAEKMDQKAPNIIAYGYVNTYPISPNIKRNTVIGGAAGAFLAIIIVIISYLLNDTIMTTEDIERKLGLNVLGTLPLEEEEYDGKKPSSKGIVAKVGKQEQK